MGFSLRGTPKSLEKKGETHERAREIGKQKSKEIEKSKDWRVREVCMPTGMTLRCVRIAGHRHGMPHLCDGLVTLVASEQRRETLYTHCQSCKCEYPPFPVTPF